MLTYVKKSSSTLQKMSKTGNSDIFYENSYGIFLLK